MAQPATESHEEPTRENPCGSIGTKIVFENEHVRVWEMDVPPRGRKPWHHHTLPYIIIATSGGRIELETVDGKIVHPPEEKVGDVLWRAAGEKHELRNLGDKVYKNVLVELKNAK